MSLPRNLLLASLVAAAACSERRTAAPEPFRVVRVSLGDEPQQAPVLLNDAITVTFSAEVEPMSVTPETVAVLDDQGHAVRGRLRVGGNWVTFEPEPPMQATLDDGSLRPDMDHRLVVAGYPRPDGVRAVDGRRLAAGFQRTFRTAAADARPDGLPAPLRPVLGGALPFLLRPQQAPEQLPVDDPRLRLHCTLPVLPSSVSADAFDVYLVRQSQPLLPGNRQLRIVPRSLRLLATPVAGQEYPGSTVEIDVGTHVRLQGTVEPVTLAPGDIVFVQPSAGRRPLRDYSGQPLQASTEAFHTWSAIAGSAALLAEWTSETPWAPGSDLAEPGFEWAPDGSLRPHVRVEAGDGRLGTFRPQRDVTLVPGQPFDRGDGTLVVDEDGVYAFAAIDVPAGVTVHVDPRGGRALLLALGRARIAGRLVVPPLGPAHSLRHGDLVDLGSVAAAATVTLLAAGGVRVTGAVETGPGAGDGTPFALVVAGPVELDGPIPLGSVLATEPETNRVQGLAQRVLGVKVRLAPGLPPGATADAVALAPYRPLPPGCTGGTMKLLDLHPGIAVEWQVVPEDPVRGGPDSDAARASPLREIRDGGEFHVDRGSFLRCRCTATVRGGAPLPSLGGVRVFDR